MEQEGNAKLHSLLDLSREVRESPEYVVYKDFLKIKTGFLICRINYFNFKEEIAHYYLKVPNLWKTSFIKRTRFQYRLTASIYNFVTSSIAFLEYNNQTEFLKTAKGCFLKELRNYVMHDEPMHLTSHVEHIHNSPNERSESLDIEGIKEFLKEKIFNSNGRNTDQREKALEYIEAKQIKKRVHIIDIIEEHFENITQIYKENALDYIKKKQEPLDKLLDNSKYILDSMEEIKYSSTIVPLDQLRIRYLKYLLYLVRK